MSFDARTVGIRNYQPSAISAVYPSEVGKRVNEYPGYSFWDIHSWAQAEPVSTNRSTCLLASIVSSDIIKSKLYLSDSLEKPVNVEIDCHVLTFGDINEVEMVRIYSFEMKLRYWKFVIYFLQTVL